MLLFWPPAPVVDKTGAISTTPAVPRIFTGKSRMGEADGAYLCERFNRQRFFKVRTTSPALTGRSRQRVKALIID